MFLKIAIFLSGCAIPPIQVPPIPQGIVAVCKADYSETEYFEVSSCRQIFGVFEHCDKYLFPRLEIKKCKKVEKSYAENGKE